MFFWEAACPPLRKSKPAGEFKWVSSAADPQRLSLGLECQLDGQERVPLGHGLFGAVEAIQNELPEKRKTHLAVHGNMPLARMVNQVHMISLAIASDIQVLAEFQVAVGTSTIVRPSPQAPRPSGVNQSTRK
jgi:hypothetical protein